MAFKVSASAFFVWAAVVVLTVAASVFSVAAVDVTSFLAVSQAVLAEL